MGDIKFARKYTNGQPTRRTMSEQDVRLLRQWYARREVLRKALRELPSEGDIALHLGIDRKSVRAAANIQECEIGAYLVIVALATFTR